MKLCWQMVGKLSPLRRSCILYLADSSGINLPSFNPLHRYPPVLLGNKYYPKQDQNLRSDVQVNFRRQLYIASVYLYIYQQPAEKVTATALSDEDPTANQGSLTEQGVVGLYPSVTYGT